MPRTRTVGEPGPLHETSEQSWDEVLATNLSGVFLAMKHEIAHMLAHGGGAIVNNGSGASVMPAVGMTGAAVDFSRSNSVKAGMQTALDATALMLAKEAAVVGQAQVLGRHGRRPGQRVVEHRHRFDGLLHGVTEPRGTGYLGAAVRVRDVDDHTRRHHEDQQHREQQPHHRLPFPAARTRFCRPAPNRGDGGQSWDAGTGSNGSTTARISAGIGVEGRAGSVLSTYTWTNRPSAQARAPSPSGSPWKSPTR